MSSDSSISRDSCQSGSGRPVGGHQVIKHAAVVGEHAGGGANLCAHVADGGHARSGQRVHTWAVVLHNGAGAALYCQDACHLRARVRACVCQCISSPRGGG